MSELPETRVSEPIKGPLKPGLNIVAQQDLAAQSIELRMKGKSWGEIADQLCIADTTLVNIRRKYKIDEAVEAQLDARLSAKTGVLTIADRVRILVSIATDRTKEASTRVAAIKLINDTLGDTASKGDLVPLTGMVDDKALSIMLQPDKPAVPFQKPLAPVHLDVPIQKPARTPGASSKALDEVKPADVPSKPASPSTGLLDTSKADVSKDEPSMSIVLKEVDGVEPDDVAKALF